MAEKFEHPLDRQNAIERAIQLEGPQDPENFKMPDGRSLAEVRQSNEEKHQGEFREETKMIGERTREMSASEITKGKDLVMTSVGNIVDVTSPPEVEKVEHQSLAEMRTSAADIELSGDFDAPKSGEAFPSASGNSGASSSTTPTISGDGVATPPSPSSTPTGRSAGEVTASDIGNQGGTT